MSSKIVEIRPNPNFSSVITGSLMLTAEYKNKKGEVILNLVGRNALVIPPEGLLLQPDEFPLHADIIKAANESPLFQQSLGYAKDVNSLGPNQRFYMHDQEQADTQEYDTNLQQHAIVEQILNMDNRVVNFAKIFGITTKDPKSCKNKLVKFANGSTEMRTKIADYFQNPDRLVLEVIYASLENGNANDKKGLYSDNGYYFYMGNSIGYGIEKVIEWIKEEQDIYTHLREEVYGATEKVSGKAAKAK
jgi:hypothetical protein